MFKRAVFLLVFCFGAYGLERFCHKATDGFLIGNILPGISPPIHATEMPLDNELRVILSQRFHYLGKGAQTYVLVSEDGNYILKFFKFQHLRPLPFMSQKKIEKRAKKQEALFTSYKLAIEEIKEESGLLLVYLQPTHQRINLRVVDRLNIEHSICGDSVPFILQRRTELLFPALCAYRQKGDVAGARELLSSVADLVTLLRDKGVYDSDFHLCKNVGILDKKALLIDCGSLSKNREKQQFKAGSLQKWLAEEWPEMAQSFEEICKSANL